MFISSGNLILFLSKIEISEIEKMSLYLLHSLNRVIKDISLQNLMKNLHFSLIVEISDVTEIDIFDVIRGLIVEIIIKNEIFVVDEIYLFD